MASAIRNVARTKLRVGMIPADGIGREVLPVSPCQLAQGHFEIIARSRQRVPHSKHLARRFLK